MEAVGKELKAVKVYVSLEATLLRIRKWVLFSAVTATVIF